MVRLLGGIALAFIWATSALAQVELTWERAMVFIDKDAYGRIDDDDVKAKLAKMPPSPVIVYLHGCGGLLDRNGKFDGRAVDTFIKLNADGGRYIVVAPDSYARPGRKSNCDPSNWSFSSNIGAIRVSEATFAVEQVRTMPWWDKKNLFLFGHSEGGAAALQYPNANVNAIISTGWSCGGGGTRPLPVPSSIPVLNIKSSSDPTDTRTLTCLGKLNGKSKFIDPQKPVHYVLALPEMYREMADWLNTYRSN